MEHSADSIRDRAAAALQRLRSVHAPAEAAPAEAPAPEQPAAPAQQSVIAVQPSDVIEPESAYDQLNERQRVFVDMLLVGNSQAEAARLAGYGPERPDIAGSKLMARPIVRNALKERRALAAEAAGIDQQQLLIEMAEIAYGRKEGMNDPIVRMRALENLLKWVGSDKGGSDNSNVARAINERFQKARLVSGSAPAPRPLLRAVP